MTKQDLKEFLIEEAELDSEDVNSMDSFRLLDAWLSYEGIIGYTNQILDVYKASIEK